MTNETPYVDFFDQDFYSRQVPGEPECDLEHFLEVGDSLGLDPGPYFSTRFYKNRYPDWQDSGAKTALEDFLLRLGSGDDQCQPHPLINPEAYRSRHPDLAQLGTDAVLHFVRHGDAEARWPSDRFDATFYTHCYMPLGEKYPFRHYALQGRGLGYQPCPVPLSRAESSRRMRHILSELTQPLVFVVHDAQRAGVPILTLDLADAAAKQGWQPVFILLRGGPLLPRFQDTGPVAILATGWDLDGIADALPQSVPVIANTAVVADAANVLAQGDRPTLLLIHEMADYLRDQEIIATLKTAQASGVKLALSMPPMVEAFQADFGTLPVIRPGLLDPHVSLSSYRNVLHRLNIAPRDASVFIGAGYGDHRKGFDLFLSAADVITDQCSDAIFVWLGEIDPTFQDRIDTARAKGVDLTLPGFVEDFAAWYMAASVYLLTSRQDPGPTTVMHAVQVGTPFVGYAADIGLIGQFDSFGQFVPPGDEDAYVSAALQSLSFSVQDRRALRRRLAPETSFERYANAVLTAVTSN